MSLIQELANQTGVLAAGEYAFRGDRFSYSGKLDEEQARMASIMCRATTMAVHMQVDMMKSLGNDCGCAPARGWVVKGEQFSVCVIGNVFCFLDNSAASLNEVMRFMLEKVSNQTGELI
jgi:roadblock/LC7 domain-containing protein